MRPEGILLGSRRLLPLLLASVSRPDVAGAVLGVAPEDEAKYAAAGFRCLDSSGPTLPKEAVNDDFCDCADGSDEPGTGACAGQEATVFYCANKGSMPRRLYASRVGDGICDCCDGSDEEGLAARSPASRCPNDCAARGAREREMAQARLATIRRGLAKQAEARTAALVEQQGWKAEIAQLQKDLPALEGALATAKVAADAEREAAIQESLKSSGGCVWRQTGGCKPDGPLEPANDKACNATIPTGASGFCDCDADGAKGDAEPGYTCEAGGPGTCAKVCLPEGSAAEPAGDAAAAPVEQAAQPEAAAAEEKPQVSEYTKWMDGAESAMAGSADGKDEAAGEEKKVSEYAKWMEGAGSAGEPAPAVGGQDASADAAGGGGEGAAASASAEPAKKSAVDVETEARKLVDANKDRAREIQSKLDALSDKYLGYSSLAGTTLSKRIGEYNFKLEFFKTAKQDHTSLGTWKKFTDPTHGSFEDGQRCWDGPARKLDVEFVCGEDGALEDVTEPSRCIYAAIVRHPGACDPAEVQVLETGSRVLGPRDEL